MHCTGHGNSPALTAKKREGKEKKNSVPKESEKRNTHYLRPKSAGTSPHSRVSHLTILLV